MPPVKTGTRTMPDAHLNAKWSNFPNSKLALHLGIWEDRRPTVVGLPKSAFFDIYACNLRKTYAAQKKKKIDFLPLRLRQVVHICILYACASLNQYRAQVYYCVLYTILYCSVLLCIVDLLWSALYCSVL